MINPAKQFNFHDYLEVFLRRLWYFVIPFAAVIIGAGIYAFIVPMEYRASTLILVTPQKVPEDFIRPTVTSRIEDRLQSIGQEIMSRTRLEQVINEFKLYQEEAKSLRREEIVELMQKNIQVQTKGKEGKGDYQGFFSISYIAKDPRIVALVTNKLASLFIEENLKLREQQAQGTSEFLSTELQATKTKLEEQERITSEYKRKNMGELPEQKEANLRVLDQLQMQAQRIGDGIKAAQDRRILIQKQLQDYEMLINTASQSLAAQEEAAQAASSSTASSPTSAAKPKNPYTGQLEQYRNYLSDLQAKYTEKHPDILLAKKKIADLEAKSTQFEASQAEAEKAEKAEPPSVASAPAKPSSAKKGISVDPRLSPRYKELENQIISVDQEIGRLQQDEVKVRNQIALYRERIENTPSREQALAILTRDYNNAREVYASLMKKSEAANQAENLERRQKGEQFKIIDPARIPEKPYRPDIPKILLIGLFLGFFGGVAVAFFREQMDRSFRDAEDLQVTLGFKVLANIPRIGAKAS
jgi:polysaccharide chain length determinant protein (PEP-CTERM system associated)